MAIAFSKRVDLNETQSRSVLLLDDSERVLKILSRHLRRRFDAIFTATDSTSAEKILKEQEISTLVCDHGVAHPSSVQLISKWRKRYKTITRAVILTGADVSAIKPSPSVDAILSKSLPLRNILTEVAK